MKKIVVVLPMACALMTSSVCSAEWQVAYTYQNYYELGDTKVEMNDFVSVDNVKVTSVDGKKYIEFNIKREQDPEFMRNNVKNNTAGRAMVEQQIRDGVLISYQGRVLADIEDGSFYALEWKSGPYYDPDYAEVDLEHFRNAKITDSLCGGMIIKDCPLAMDYIKYNNSKMFEEVEKSVLAKYEPVWGEEWQSAVNDFFARSGGTIAFIKHVSDTWSAFYPSGGQSITPDLKVSNLTGHLWQLEGFKGAAIEKKERSNSQMDTRYPRPNDDYYYLNPREKDKSIVRFDTNVVGDSSDLIICEVYGSLMYKKDEMPVAYSINEVKQGYPVFSENIYLISQVEKNDFEKMISILPPGTRIGAPNRFVMVPKSDTLIEIHWLEAPDTMKWNEAMGADVSELLIGEVSGYLRRLD
ncbi:MAG: hypothetical protein E7200_08525 [Selenomonas ruminantium]|nr:hypothetical protein [Selenomonas ruminantium]